MGAVMGSKNLKAVANRGTKKWIFMIRKSSGICQKPYGADQSARSKTRCITQGGPTSICLAFTNAQGILYRPKFPHRLLRRGGKTKRRADEPCKAKRAAMLVRCAANGWWRFPPASMEASEQLRRPGIRNAELPGIAPVHRRPGGHRQGHELCNRYTLDKPI